MGKAEIKNITCTEAQTRGFSTYGISLGRLEEICNAERDGRLVVLPCKVGDAVYVDTRTFMYGDRNGRAYAEGLVTSFVFGHRNFIKFHIFSPYIKQHKVYKYPLSAVGVTVFLSYEAAEAARKEQEK